MPSQIFGLRFAIPPSKSQYVLSKCFVKIKRDPRASQLSCAHNWLSPGKGQPGRDVPQDAAPWVMIEPICPFHRWTTLMGWNIFWGKAAQNRRSVRKGQQRVKVVGPLQPTSELLSFPVFIHLWPLPPTHPLPPLPITWSLCLGKTLNFCSVTFSVGWVFFL